VFLDHFDMLMSKIIFLKIKKYYFNTFLCEKAITTTLTNTFVLQGTISVMRLFSHLFLHFKNILIYIHIYIILI